MTSSLSGSTGPTGNQIPKGWRTGRLQQYDPMQMGVYQNLGQFVSPGSQLSQAASGSEAGFAPFKETARRALQENTGGLASRFSELAPGAMSARKGSGFKIESGQRAQDFALALATKRQELQQQALSDLLGISHTLLGARPYQQFMVPKQYKQRPDKLGQILGVGLPIAGAAAGGAFGGPMGAALGGQLGTAAARGYSGIGGGPSYSDLIGSPTSWRDQQQSQNQWQPTMY